MPRFFTLASSSTGNCSCFCSPEGNFLLDCGISANRIFDRLHRNQVDPDSLSGILITHEHTDHVKGLHPFLRKKNLPVYASAACLSALEAGGCLLPGTRAVCVEQEVSFSLDDVQVTPFATSHDSVGPLCYRFSFAEQEAAVLTDTGLATDRMLSVLSGVDLILLESNYDPLLLQTGPYPYSLKQRISGQLGHLSNKQASEVAKILYESGTTRFILGHLSQENNTPALAKEAVKNALAGCGAEENRDYQLFVAPVDEVLPVCIF